MTTIPNEAGWQVQVDGQTVTTKAAAGMFTAVPMTVGHHHVSFRYRPPFFTLALVISLISLTACWWLAKHDQKD
jgi:uncharacterized membrane protein YfhO